MIEKILSIKDPRIILARELHTNNGRKKHNKFLLYGLEQINWALKNNLEILYIFTNQKIDSVSDKKLLEVSDGILKKISDTNYLVPIIGLAEMPNIKEYNKDFILVLDNIKDYGNLGSIVRTARSFSIDKFIFSNNNADPFQRKAIDSSRGLVFSSNLDYKENVDQTIKDLKESGYQLIITSPYAKNIQSLAPIDITKPIALVVGNESDGVDQQFIEQADIAIQIPMNYNVESLNVGIAAGISIYELKFKQTLLMLKEKIFTNFGREVNILGKLIKMALDKEISKVSNLTGDQLIIMMIMHCDKTMTKNQIIRDASLLDQEFDNFIRPMISENLISIENEFYQVTISGKNFLAEMWPIVEKSQQKILSELTKNEIQEFLKISQKIKNSCIKIIEEKI